MHAKANPTQAHNYTRSRALVHTLQTHYITLPFSAFPTHMQNLTHVCDHIRAWSALFTLVSFVFLYLPRPRFRRVQSSTWVRDQPVATVTTVDRRAGLSRFQGIHLGSYWNTGSPRGNRLIVLFVLIEWNQVVFLTLYRLFGQTLKNNILDKSKLTQMTDIVF